MNTCATSMPTLQAFYSLVAADLADVTPDTTSPSSE